MCDRCEIFQQKVVLRRADAPCSKKVVEIYEVKGNVWRTAENRLPFPSADPVATFPVGNSFGLVGSFRRDKVMIYNRETEGWTQVSVQGLTGRPLASSVAIPLPSTFFQNSDEGVEDTPDMSGMVEFVQEMFHVVIKSLMDSVTSPCRL